MGDKVIEINSATPLVSKATWRWWWNRPNEPRVTAELQSGMGNRKRKRQSPVGVGGPSKAYNPALVE